MAAKVKLTLYFPEDMLKQAQLEAERQDRSLSWIVQHAWKIAYDKLKSYPSVETLATNEVHTH
jgi:uncharacterized small protein (TIGR04563 family)